MARCIATTASGHRCSRSGVRGLHPAQCGTHWNRATAANLVPLFDLVRSARDLGISVGVLVEIRATGRRPRPAATACTNEVAAP